MLQQFSLNLGGGTSTATPFDPTSSAQVIPLFDDLQLYQTGSYNGQLQLFFTANGTGTWTRNTVSTANKGRYGILVGCSGTTASANATATSGIESFLPGSIQMEYALALQLQSVPTSTDNYVTRFGFVNTFPGVQNGIYFTVDRTLSTTNWCTATTQASTSTTTVTSVALDTAWHNLHMIINSAGTQVQFYIDGTLVATHTTNIPTASGQNCGAQIQQQTVGTGTTQNNFNIFYDWVFVRYQLSVNRGTL